MSFVQTGNSTPILRQARYEATSDTDSTSSIQPALERLRDDTVRSTSSILTGNAARSRSYLPRPLSKTSIPQQNSTDPPSMQTIARRIRIPSVDGGRSRKNSNPQVHGLPLEPHILDENDPTIKPIEAGLSLECELTKAGLLRSSDISRGHSFMEEPVPAIPLRSLARELRKSDATSSGVTEASSSTVHRQRQRFGSWDDTQRSTRAFDTSSRSRVKTARMSESMSIPSPRQASSRRTTVQSIPGAQLRKPSLTLQPLRSKKVTITEDDMHNQQRPRRQLSLSVQPIRRQCRSMDEDLSDDFVKKPRTASSQDLQATEERLQKSIAGLDRLMQEAVELAKQAADSGHFEEVPIIVQEARTAFRTVTRPPDIRRSSPSSSSCSSLSSERLRQIRTDGPISEPDASSDGGGAKSVWDEEWPHHRLDSAKSEDPKAIDFATRPTNPRTLTGDHPLLNQQRPPLRSGARSQMTAPTIASRSTQDSRQDLRMGMEGAVSPVASQHLPDVPDEPPQTAPTRPEASSSQHQSSQQSGENWGRDKFDEKDYVRTNTLKGKHHITLRDNEHFSIRHGHRHQPISRNWGIKRKRIVASVACINTALVGLLIGIYYTLADLRHQVILGNVYLYVGMAITTFLFWPLPLLHGRKPYTLLALGTALPLQIPQAIIVRERRELQDDYGGYMTGLLLSRAVLGLALGFAHINFKATLLDLYGASLQSEFPHGEVVIVDDVRRHGGGMGYWLGIWSFSFIGSLACGFLVGAGVVSGLNQAWGFYIGVIVIAVALLLNVVTPETRRSPHRRTMQEVELPNDSISRRVARGEIKMHVTGDGPKWWWEEVFAGVYLSIRMLLQSGFVLMALYMGWIYAQVVLIIVLLGNLLSARYSWTPGLVGLGVFAVAVGAALAIPNSKANFFSRSRNHPPRTDSMTFQPRVGWTSHLVRRAMFMTALPVAGLAYTLASAGAQVQYMVPVVFAALIGYISNLAIAECNGIIMETFDTSDLQPGTNSRHRLQSLSANIRRRRTTYTSYPRVSAGLFSAQALGFLLAAAATGVGGAVTRTVGAQRATAITAGILLFLTLLLTCALMRLYTVQVIPNELFGQYFGSAAAERRKSAASMDSDRSWRAVIIGNPSGKLRRMSWLELGSLSRWTEIRRLNRLLNRSTTQGLSPGWQ